MPWGSNLDCSFRTSLETFAFKHWHQHHCHDPLQTPHPIKNIQQLPKKPHHMPIQAKAELLPSSYQMATFMQPARERMPRNIKTEAFVALAKLKTKCLTWRLHIYMYVVIYTCGCLYVCVGHSLTPHMHPYWQGKARQQTHIRSHNGAHQTSKLMIDKHQHHTHQIMMAKPKPQVHQTSSIIHAHQTSTLPSH